MNLEQIRAKKNLFLKIEVFEGVGKFHNNYYKIKLKAETVSVAKPLRVPIEIVNSFKESLMKLVEMGIISKVTESREWVHILVIVEKSDGALRFYLDPVSLNKHIMKEQFLIPTLDKLITYQVYM